MKRLMLLPCVLAGAALFGCSDHSMPTPPIATASISQALASPPPGGVIPSGERTIGQTTLEPVYDGDHAGAIGYVSTPMHVTVHANPNAWAPFYVVLYPTASADVDTAVVGTLLCAHEPADNCPDHGPLLAGLAAAMEPSVYTNAITHAPQVAGHDHVMSFPGGGDFNINWEPIAVLFTNSNAAEQHLVTVNQIMAAVASGDAILDSLPPAVFHCSPVSVAVWNRATPVTPQ